MSFAPLALATMQQKRSLSPLYMKWRTTTSNETITLPLRYGVGVNYNFIIDWGDGQVSQIIAYNDVNRIHTYAVAGDYITRISGTCEGWRFNNGGDKLKLLEVWGGKGHVFKLLDGGFSGCSNLTRFDCPDLSTSNIVNLTTMFYNCVSMGSCMVDNWDVSNCTDFGRYVFAMFAYCSSLISLNCSNWRFTSSSNITMGAFWNCSNLTTIGDTSLWNTEKFYNIDCMFYNCQKLTAVDVSTWDVSNVLYFGSGTNTGMFYNCKALTSLNCSGWRFASSGAITMADAFRNCSNLTTIGNTINWNTERITNWNYCFANDGKLASLDMTNWDFTNATTVGGICNACGSLTSVGDLSNKNFSSCTIFGNYVYGMFYSCVSLTSLDCSGWTFHPTADIQFGGVFRNCTNLTTIGDVSGWNTSRFRYLDSTFMGCAKLLSIDLSNWDVSNCIDFGSGTQYTGFMMGCSALTSVGDLSGWRFNTMTDVVMYNSFNGCSNLTTIGDVSDWNTGKIKSFYSTFRYCNKLVSVDMSGWDFSNCITTVQMFSSCSSLTSVGDLSNKDFSSCTDFGNVNFGMFSDCTSLTSLDCSGWTLNTTTNITGFSIFRNCTNLTTIGDVSGWNTSKVTKMNSTFYNCKKLASVDVSTWDVSNCTDFGNGGNYSMFSGCWALTSVGDLSGWRFSTTQDIYFKCVFIGCVKLTTIGDISGWNTGKIINFEQAFYNTGITSLNCSNWDVSNCTNFNQMFQVNSALTSLNISGWTLNTTTNITMYQMFSGCAALTSLSFTGWNTSKVTNFQQFLDGCYALATCDVSVLSTAAATNVSYMFRNCRSMTAINISGWDLSKVVAASMTQYMFYGCYGLTSLTLPASLSRVDNQFAIFGGTPAITVYNINRATAPTVSGTPFGNYAKPLHVPVSNSGYNVAPWTNTAIFSSIIADL